jgi:hypothetical protein
MMKARRYILLLLAALYITTSALAAGTSQIYSVYFRTHYWNSGLFVDIRANCSHGVFLDLNGYDGPSRGPLNGTWRVNLPTLGAGQNHKVSVTCHSSIDHAVSWSFNVYYKNGSLAGTYLIGKYNQ